MLCVDVRRTFAPKRLHAPARTFLKTFPHLFAPKSPHPHTCAHTNSLETKDLAYYKCNDLSFIDFCKQYINIKHISI